MDLESKVVQRESFFFEAINIFLEPYKHFEKLKCFSGWGWGALFFSTIVYGLIIYWFFHGMSLEWVVDQQMAKISDVSPADIERVKSYVTTSSQYIDLISCVTSMLTLLLTCSLFSGYYKLISRSNKYSYGQWYNFSLWTMMPMLINGLGLILLVFLSGTRDVPLDYPNYASLNQLLLNLPQDNSLYNWADSLNMFSLWSIFLAAIGLQSWAKISPPISYILAALPFVIFMGIWLLIVLF